MVINQDFLETLDDSDYGFERWLTHVVAQAAAIPDEVAPVSVLPCDDKGVIHI